MGIAKLERSVIPACDVPSLQGFEELIKTTHVIQGIGAYKLGLQLTILHGLPKLVEIARRYTTLPLIYDHQKAGNDIPELGPKFAKSCRESGIDAIILFPFAGRATARNWIRACQDEALSVIVGGHMTQKEFLYSEGGFISDEAPLKIFEIAIQEGVTDFVVPGNKVEAVLTYRSFLEDSGVDFSLYAPGFISQGGEISECGKVAGNKWHAIIGSGIYKAPDMHQAAIKFTKQLVQKK